MEESSHRIEDPIYSVSLDSKTLCFLGCLFLLLKEAAK